MMSKLSILLFVASVWCVEAQISCVNKAAQCDNWRGYCNNNEYVKVNCPKTCRTCPSQSAVVNPPPNRNDPRRATLCADQDKNCPGWVALDFTLCARSDHIRQFCPGSCRFCQPQTLTNQQQQQIFNQQFQQQQALEQQRRQQLLNEQQQFLVQQSHNLQRQTARNQVVQRAQPEQRRAVPVPNQQPQAQPAPAPAPAQPVHNIDLPTAAPTTRAPQVPCVDDDDKCSAWVDSNFGMCTQSPYVKENCRKRCGYCFEASSGRRRPTREYDITRLPQSLQPISFLLGVWRSEHAGKARFPTIPVFTYGEEISFSISDQPQFGANSLNYTAFAFGINEAKELHSEYGFLAVRNNTDSVALTTVMNNGFVTVEEGRAIGNSIRLRLQDIGRISFSRDLPVHDLVREFRLIDARTMEQKLDMETLTHAMQEHTSIRYKKIFP